MDRYKVYEIIIKKSQYKQEQDLELAVDEVEQAIKNYCSIPRVPKALHFTVANMAIDLLDYYSEKNKDTSELGIDDIDMSDVSSIKIGDTAIGIGESRRDNQRKKLLNSHIGNLDDIVMNYREQLNHFRRLW